MILVTRDEDGKTDIIDTETKTIFKDCWVKSITYENIQGQMVIEKDILGDISRKGFEHAEWKTTSTIR